MVAVLAVGMVQFPHTEQRNIVNSLIVLRGCKCVVVYELNVMRINVNAL